MASISIPSRVLPGFKQIAELSTQQIQKLVSFLNDFTISRDLDELTKFLSVDLSIKSADEMALTIVSFSELLEPSDTDYEELAENLTASYMEVSEGALSEKKASSLKKNLIALFKNSSKLKLTLKAKRLFYDNDNLIKETQVITDLRPVFNEALDDKNRSALVLHRLHLVYYEGQSSKEHFFTLDFKDLEKLKEDIDRAIQKETTLKEDYKDAFKFI